MLIHLAHFLVPAVGNHSTWLQCYIAPHDGYNWQASKFHQYCDGKKHTFVIIKNGQYVFGGYTDIPWGNYFFFRFFPSPLYYQHVQHAYQTSKHLDDIFPIEN